MSNIEQIVDVQVSRQTTAVSQEGFGVMMFLGLHKRFNERALSFSSTKAMLEAGFSTTDQEYIAASAYFSSEVTPDKIVIGRQKASDTQTLTVQSAVGAGVEYSFSIDDGDGEQVFTRATIGTETAADAADAIEQLITNSTLNIIADDSAADGTLTLTPTVAGKPYTFTSSSNIGMTITTTESLTDAIVAVEQEAAFYGLATYSHEDVDIIEIATYVESNKKLYGYSTSNDTDKTTATSDIMGQLQALSFDRTFGIWGGKAGISANDALQYPEAAWMGNRFPDQPGSANWMFKTLNGITVDKMQLTESENIRNKNGNTYETIGGVNITREGKVASGEYIDVIRGIDWLESRMEERVYSRFVNLPKIPYTNAGIAIIESEVRAQVQDGITAGVIDGEQKITFKVPKVADIPVNDRANRILPPITFEAKLAGAINKTIIRGTVTA